MLYGISLSSANTRARLHRRHAATTFRRWWQPQLLRVAPRALAGPPPHYHEGSIGTAATAQRHLADHRGVEKCVARLVAPRRRLEGSHRPPRCGRTSLPQQGEGHRYHPRHSSRHITCSNIASIGKLLGSTATPHHARRLRHHLAQETPPYRLSQDRASASSFRRRENVLHTARSGPRASGRGAPARSYERTTYSPHVRGLSSLQFALVPASPAITPQRLVRSPACLSANHQTHPGPELSGDTPAARPPCQSAGLRVTLAPEHDHA